MTAIVVGASSGLGRALPLELARSGKPLLLIASATLGPSVKGNVPSDASGTIVPCCHRNWWPPLDAVILLCPITWPRLLASLTLLWVSPGTTPTKR